MMNIKKGKKGYLVVVACLFILLALPLQATSYLQTKQIDYQPLNLYIDNTQTTLSQQPVLIDNVTYIPLRALSNALGIGIRWDQGTKSIYVTQTSNNNVISLQQQIISKDYEISSLKAEVAQLKAQIANNNSSSSSSSSSSSGTFSKNNPTTGKDILGTELTYTQNQLKTLFGDEFDDIEFDFKLRLSSSKLKLTISYDTSKENRAYDKLKSRDIKSFLEDVCEEVRDYHKDIIIDGTIEYTNTDTTKTTFTYSKKDVLTVGSSSSSSEESTILSYLNTLNTLYAKGTETNSAGFTVYKREVTIDDKNETISFRLELDLSGSYKELWNVSLGRNNDDVLRSELRVISRAIERLMTYTDYEDYEIVADLYSYTDKASIGSYDYEDDLCYKYSY